MLELQIEADVQSAVGALDGVRVDQLPFALSLRVAVFHAANRGVNAGDDISCSAGFLPASQTPLATCVAVLSGAILREIRYRKSTQSCGRRASVPVKPTSHQMDSQAAYITDPDQGPEQRTGGRVPPMVPVVQGKGRLTPEYLTHSSSSLIEVLRQFRVEDWLVAFRDRQLRPGRTREIE